MDQEWTWTGSGSCPASQCDRLLQPGQGGLVKAGRLYDDKPKVVEGVSGIPGLLY